MDLAEDPAGIPPWPDVDAFIRNLDGALDARRSGGAGLVLFTEEPPGRASARMLRGIRDHCTGDHRPLAPRVLLTVEAGDGLVGLVQQCAAELKKLPRGAGRLRLSQYELLERVVTAAGLPQTPGDRTRELRHRLHRGRSGEEQDGGQAERLSGLLGWLAGLPAVLGQIRRSRLSERLFGLWINRRMTGRRSWFARWSEAQTGNPCTDFFAEAHRLAPDGRHADRAGTALLHALLDDLDRSLRGALWSPWRARRTRYVLLAEAEPGGEEALQELLTAYRQAAGSLGSRATVCFARVTPERCAELGVAERAGLAEVPTAPGRAGPPRGDRAVAVAAPSDGTWRSGPVRREKLPPRPALGVRAGLAVRVTALLAVLGLLGAGGVWAVEAVRDTCPGGQFPGPGGSACYGISDGGDYFPAMHEDFRPLFDMVRATNTRAEEMARGGWQVRTVVHIASYTAASDDPEVVQDSALKELRGIALAQQNLVGEARQNNRKVVLRVLLADAGPRFEAGRRVAEDVKALTAAEQIIGVIGLGQSRQGTYDTMAVLDGANTAMIGTTATADAMQQRARYYQMAPDNRRQADVAVSFLRHYPAVVRDGGERVAAESAVVASDPHDDYSRNLAEDFVAAFDAGIGGAVEEVHYQPQDPRNQEADAPRGSEAESDFGRVAHGVCERLAQGPAAVLFWAGREGDLIAFMNEAGRTPGCEPITVLGGDAVANALTGDADSVTRHGGLTLYYLAHAVPEHGDNHRAELFLDQYRQQFPEAGEQDYAVATLGWDALELLGAAATRAYSRSSGEFDKDVVTSLLSTGDASVQGVTGVLDPSSDHRVPQAKPVFVLHGTRSGSEVLLSCGRLAFNVEHTTWGPGGHPCP